METIHLEGAEDVRRASGQMGAAADNMQRAASSMSDSVDRIRMVGDEFLMQFTGELRRDQEHRTAWIEELKAIFSTSPAARDLNALASFAPMFAGGASPAPAHETAAWPKEVGDVLGIVAPYEPFTCKARAGSTGAGDPQDCEWPVCGCDPYADKVIAAMEEAGGAIANAVNRNDVLTAQVRLLQAQVDLVNAYDIDLIPRLEKDLREPSK